MQKTSVQVYNHNILKFTMYVMSVNSINGANYYVTMYVTVMCNVMFLCDLKTRSHNNLLTPAFVSFLFCLGNIEENGKAMKDD